MMDKLRFPSLLHAFLAILFGSFAGIVLRWHYSKQDERKTGSWFWYLSWLAVVAGLSNPRCARSNTCESLGHPHHAHEELNLAWVKPPYSAARVIICA